MCNFGCLSVHLSYMIIGNFDAFVEDNFSWIVVIRLIYFLGDTSIIVHHVRIEYFTDKWFREDLIESLKCLTV